jgi:RNA 2',3'-cyclic 3'-phosphodiesterase
MPRLFIAIDVPKSLRDAVAERQVASEGVRWVTVANLHLTLRFVGRTSDAEATVIRDLLRAVDTMSFPLETSGVLTFPNLRRPRVLAIGLRESEHLQTFKASVDRLLTDHVDMERPTGSFAPHVTIARFKRARVGEVRRVRGAFDTLPPNRFHVDEFVLYESTLTPAGAYYKRLATYALAD